MCYVEQYFNIYDGISIANDLMLFMAILNNDIYGKQIRSKEIRLSKELEM